jgi:parvulin-like peptidyl-prolyl isomerase
MFMKKFTKSAVLLCVAVPLLATHAADQNAATNNGSKPVIQADDLFTNSIVAKGKGVKVTRSDLDDAMVEIKTAAAGRGQTIPPQYMPMIEQQQLQSLIAKQLLSAKVTDADKAAGKTKFEEGLKKLKENSKLSDEEFNQKLDQQLKIAGQTRDQWNHDLTEKATLQAVIQRELKPAPVTDDDAKKFYDENPAKFEQPEKVRAAHVLISTKDPTTGAEMSDTEKAAKKKIAEDVLKRAKAGEDFAKLAKEYSDDPGSKNTGGEYTFPRGQMMPAFEEAAFSLKTNQVSDIVTTSYGYHIIKLYEKIPAKKEEFSDVKDDIKEYLAQSNLQKQIPDYIEKLEKAADVQILDESLKPPTESTEAAATEKP